jgi:sulfur carrier protein
MKILLNGTAREIEDDASVAVLLAATDYAQRRVAVEVNREIVPRSQHSERRLRAGDRVEIVQAMGGG